MPCAIGYVTRVQAFKRRDESVHARSCNGARALFDVREISKRRAGDWSDYLRGVFIVLHDAGIDLGGTDLHVEGEVPIGAGLSSSASLAAAVALALLALAGASIEPRELALLLQRAENEYAGTRSGVMDQFTVLHARRGFALALDTRSLDFDFVAVPAHAAVVICNTMLARRLSGGAYNARREECEQSAVLIRSRYPHATQLRDVSSGMLETCRDLLAPVLYRRARHVVTENARVLAAANALRDGDVRAFGDLMNESHESLREDYEVSCAELDLLVSIARTIPGVYGARMTGGGFGGCTVNLVQARAAAQFRAELAERYWRETGLLPELYDGTPVDGASVSIA